MDYKGDQYYIDQVLKGNISSFSHMVDRHKDRVFNLAFRICGNREDAEEVAQDSFLKAFRSLREFKRRSRFTTWLYRIVYNTSISFVRRRKNGAVSLNDFSAAGIEPGVLNEDPCRSEEEYRSRILNFALQNVNEEERTLISLFYYEEMNLDDIAELTGIGKQNVKVKLFRARQKMHAILAEAENKRLMYHE